MDTIVKYYMWGSILLGIFFFIVSSNFLYWFTNRLSTNLAGPALYSWAKGGPTLAGMLVHAILFGAIFFGIIDYLYSRLNTSNAIDDNEVSIG